MQICQLQFLFKSNVGMRKRDLCVFNHVIVVGARLAGMSILEYSEAVRFSYTAASRVYTEVP